MTSNHTHHTRHTGLILDMDGTLMQGDQPLPGLIRFFEALRQGDVPFVIATNNAQHSPRDYQRKLCQCGVTVKQQDIITAAIATASILKNLIPLGSLVYVIGQPALTSEIQQAGFRIEPGFSQPAAAVIVGGDPDLTYEKLKMATLHIQREARFIGTNPDLLYPTEQGLVPECGTTLAALQAATGVQPFIVGKPGPILFQQAAARLGTAPDRTFVVGDRLETDILGGQRAGYRTILISTGVDQASAIGKKAIFPDYTVQDLDQLRIWLGENL